MTSEEIIQRLLDEKKITTKEALIILKDLAKIGFQQIFVPQPQQPIPWNDNVVVMYGIGVPPNTTSDIKDSISTQISSNS